MLCLLCFFCERTQILHLHPSFDLALDQFNPNLCSFVLFFLANERFLRLPKWQWWGEMNKLRGCEVYVSYSSNGRAKGNGEKLWGRCTTVNSQQSNKSKTGLGYDSQGVDSQVLENHVNDKYNACEGYLTVSPSYTGNYMPFKLNEHVVSDSKDEDKIETESKQIKHSFAKEKFVKSIEHVKFPRKSVKHPSSRAAISVNTARPTNTAYPRSTVNGAKPSSNVFHKSHLPVRRTCNQRTTPKNSDLKETINTAKETSPSLQIIKRLMVDLLHLEEVQKEVKLLEKGKIKTGKLDFEHVYFVKKLKFNLFSDSQMFHKKNSVLFTKIECLVLSLDFKLLDENQVLLKVPRQNNMSSFDLKNVAPQEV
nr:ribonuclease H-like domain-containing protein [Tanacetum cinerariifolium]